MNFDYNKAKLIFFTSAQYTGEIFSGHENIGAAKSNFSYFRHIITGNNGYIITPTVNYTKAYVDENEDDGIGNEKNYGLNEFIKNNSLNTDLADVCFNEIKAFVDDILKNESGTALWIGTPIISSDNYKTLDSVSTVATVLSIYKEYISKLIEILGTTIWQKNVKGIYYNQEAIYGDNATGENMLTATTSYPYMQYKLINDFSYYLHNDLEKDLVWIPYLPVYVDSDADADTFKRVGTMINKTTCFDCAFIQPFLSSLYSLYDGTVFLCDGTSGIYSIDKSSKNDSGVVYYDEYYSRRERAKQNITAIIKSIEDNQLYYRDGNPVNSDSNSFVGNCIIGGEYELNQDKDPHYVDLGEGLFSEYSRFDSYVGSKPFAFYWQGNVKEVCEKIGEKYDQRDYDNVIWVDSDGNTLDDNKIGIDGGAGDYSGSHTYTSNFPLEKGDKVNINLEFWVDPENLDGVTGYAGDDFEFIVGDSDIKIEVNIDVTNGKVVCKYNSVTSSSYSASDNFIVDDDLDGKYLSIETITNILRIDGNPLGFWFEFEIIVNDKVIIPT